MPSIDLQFFLFAYLKMIFEVIQPYILQKINSFNHFISVKFCSISIEF